MACPIAGNARAFNLSWSCHDHFTVMAYRRRKQVVDEHPNQNFEANWNERIDDFEQMGLNDNIVRGIFTYGFKRPSEIQSLAIKPICDGRQVIAQAQSGTGKTGAFGIGVLNVIDTSISDCQALLISPTRELAQQTSDFIQEIGKYMDNLRVSLFVGGHEVAGNEHELMVRKPQIVVGTPGRLLDLLESRNLNLAQLRILCLDEADQMLKDNFGEAVSNIMTYCPVTAQILLFSATIPLSAFNIMDQFMKDPVKILVKAEELTLEGISQFYVELDRDADKWPTLVDIFGSLPIQKCVIFGSTRKEVEDLATEMRNAGHEVSLIHSGLSQSERENTMKKFRVGAARVLISTDLIARGIDVQQVTLVINFSLPREKEQYIHRIGRSGRMGRKGIAINLCNKEEMKTIRFYERHYQTSILPLPGNYADMLQEVNQSQD